MKRCPQCGEDSDHAVIACPRCGTWFDSLEPVASPRELSRTRLILVACLVFFGVVALLVGLPYAFPFFVATALFYLPVYGPFLVSFALNHQWKALKRSLRAASAFTLLVVLAANSNSLEFGSDVSGSFAGAAYNLKWTWGTGAAATTTALLAGIAARLRSRWKSGLAAAQENSEGQGA